jgi:hypothetical protein
MVVGKQKERLHALEIEVIKAFRWAADDKITKQQRRI